MRRIAVVVVGLACSLGVADEVQVADVAFEDAAATAVRHEQAEITAQAAREALDMLLNGVEVEPTATQAESGQNKSVQREEIVRDEPSLAHIPSGRMPAKAYTKFAGLRDKLRNTQDVLVLTDELASFVNANPQHREARITLGRLQILVGEPKEALRTFSPLLESAHAKSHPDWQPWFWAGTAYLALTDMEMARQHLDVAVAKNGGVVDVWIQLAVLEQETGNHAGALQYIAIAEQIDSQAAAVYLNRAYSLEQMGRFEEALKAYQRFLVSDMDSAAKSLRPTILRRIATIAAAVEPQRPNYKRS
jgi:tetratricopeptide (TPR) repeat protein